MTLQHFQSALAHVIRRPPESLEVLQELFLDYDLSVSERSVIEQLAGDRLVKDFSDEMRDKRWSAIRRVTSCLRPFIAEKQLKELCREDFEQKHAQTPFADISISFLEYLATDVYAKAALAPLTPDFFLNLVQYLFTVSYFSRGTMAERLVTPVGSLLTHTRFKICELDYDVRELAEEIIEPNDLRQVDYIAQEEDVLEEHLLELTTESLPEKRSLTLLFVADQTFAEFRSFEIDVELRDFLTSQLSDPPVKKRMPSCYAQLALLGLCRPLSKTQMIAQEINVALEHYGFLHFKQGISEDLFREVASNLGTIVAADDIKLNLSKRKLHSPEGLEFHTDSYLSDLNAWWCEEPAEVGGAMMLIDTADIPQHFSKSEMELLTDLEMECPNRTHTKFYKRQLLTNAPSGRQIFYTPWLPVEPISEELKKLRLKFASYIEEKRRTSAIEILFSKGDCLFINNKRVLHGREALHPGTKRHLKRLWIATGAFDTRLLE